MIKMTDHLFTEAILNNALNHFGIDKNSIIKHEGFCSYVFEGNIKNQKVILKISHSSRIKKEDLASELAFVLHLNNHNVKICPALTSYEEIFDLADAEGGVFYTYLYQKIEGSDFGEKTDKTESDIQEVGRILASLHKASLSFNWKNYNLLSFIDRDFVDYKKIIPKSEVTTHQCFDKIIQDLKNISKTNLNYGMTHGDSHDGNFLIDEKKITLIDFDDIEPGFFVNDLAIFLDHVCDVKDEKLQTKERIEFVFSNLMKGYKEILTPDLNLIAQIPLFMKFRWIMNHCLAQLIHGDQLKKDEKHIGFHANRVGMFANDFKKLDYLYKFDFEGSYRKL